MSTNEDLIGRSDVNDLEEILQISNTDVNETIHAVTDNADALFTWNYQKGERPALNRLYEKAKTSQWNGETDLPWDTVVDQEEEVRKNQLSNSTGVNEQMDLSGTPFEKFGEKEWLQVGIESQNWMLSQFMHGEQGALVCTAKIVETVPWIDAKYYAATQVMDEARHVEVFAKYLDTKLSGHYPLNAHLGMLLDDIVQDSRWDMTYLGMQIMVEGLALAAFGFMHQMTTGAAAQEAAPLRDERRGPPRRLRRAVAEGVLRGALRRRDARERQEFAFEAAVRMRDRFLQQEVWDRMGLDAKRGGALIMEVPEPDHVPVDAVRQDRAELQEAGPARRGRRPVAPPEVRASSG